MSAPDPRRTDQETARRLLALVPHARRFPVGRLVPPVGLLPGFVRSLGELELALRPEPASLAGLDLTRLAEWIEETVGDPVAAAEVRAAAASAPSYVEACQAVHRRIQARVAWARGAIGAEGTDAGPGAGREA